MRLLRRTLLMLNNTFIVYSQEVNKIARNMLRKHASSKITKHSHVQNNCQKFYNAQHDKSHVTYLINHTFYTNITTFYDLYLLNTFY